MSRKPSPMDPFLARALSALEEMEGKPVQAGGKTLPLEVLVPSPQPRKRFENLEALAESIREKGVLQPLLVRPLGDGRYAIVAGERRYRAARMAGLSEVPVRVVELSEKEARLLALVENLQREDLSPVEEARGYQALLEMGLTQEEVARRVGKARSTVANALRLLQLPPEALEALERGEITAGHARALLMLEPEDRLWGLKEILEKGLSVRQAEALRERLAMAPKRPAEPSPLSLELSRHLGLPVRVVGGKKGKVVIQYRSLEELEALLRRLGYQA